MSDISAGLIVAAVTATAVAGIFHWTGRVKKRKIEALRSLCAQNGWKYMRDSGALHHGHRIEGEGWVFEAFSRSSGREAAPGSSDWAHSSQWRAAGEDPGRGTFILGSRLGGMLDLSRMPPQLLSRYLSDEIAGLRPFAAGERLDARYVLFASEKPPAMGFLEARSEDLLLAWPGKRPIVVRSSPARLSLTALNQCLEEPKAVAAFIELGMSLAAR